MTPPARGPTFASELRRLREARGLSQARLATLAGLSQSYIGMVETGQRGRRPSRAIILQLAAALDAEPDGLLAAAGLDPGVVEPMAVSVPAAIEADDSLGPREKRLLLELYEVLVGTPEASDGR